METYITTALKQLGCTTKEIRLYLASYALGPAKIPELAKKARLQRSTTYLVADQLIAKQLLIDDNSAYAKQVIAASPDTLLRLLETRKRRISRSSLAISDNLDELRTLYGSTDTMPRISVFHGAHGLRTARDHILSAQSEILLWTNQELERRIFGTAEHDAFVADRVRKDIPLRVLAVNNPAGRELPPHDHATLRETRFLSPESQFSAETYIFGQKVVILDFTADIIAIVIENSSVAQAQRAMFELAWQTHV